MGGPCADGCVHEWEIGEIWGSKDLACHIDLVTMRENIVACLQRGDSVTLLALHLHLGVYDAKLSWAVLAPPA